MTGRHHLIFQKKTQATDESTGAIAETYADRDDPGPDDFTLRATPVSSTSREYFEAQRRNPELTHVFKIRFRRGGIDSRQYQVLYSAEPGASPPNYDVFMMFPPRPDEKNRYMLIELRQLSS